MSPVPGPGRPVWWRVAAPVAFVVAGGLFLTSALNSGGSDVRAARVGNLEQLVNAESHHADVLKRRAEALDAQVEQLSSRVSDKRLQRLQSRAARLEEPAGMQAVHGPGLTVTLSDAPQEVIANADSADVEVSKLVVHQQDIQAVANAMWAGGAEAMTIQGQRIISTTGIKCVGNVVILHGIPYSPPYRISAIGDPAAMQSQLDASPYIGFYKQVVHDYQLGYDEQVEDRLAMPAYPSTPTLEYASVPGKDAGGAGTAPLTAGSSR